MIKNQKNKFTMYEAVTAYLGENNLLFSDNEEFTDHLNSFRATVSVIAIMEDERSKSITGKTKNKLISRKTVTDEALAVAGAIYAYAKKSGNVTLMESVNPRKSKYDRFRENVLVIELNFIKDKAIENSQALERYGISADKLSQFTDNITAFSNAIGARAAGGAAKSSATKTLFTRFNEAGDILDSIDRLMEIYRVSNNEFYQGYKSARVIWDLGIRHKVQDKQPVTAGQFLTEKF
ncbi:MAG: hypothetical protein WAT71_15105 [Ignavibacteria bacterium]